MPIFIAMALAGAALCGGGYALNKETLTADWEKFKLRLSAARTGSASLEPVLPGQEAPATAPLRVPVAGGRPLWMEDSDVPAEGVDPRLANVLVFDPVLDSKERKATHWTLHDGTGPLDDSGNSSRGDGGA